MGILEVLSLAHNNLTNIESGALVSQKHIETIHLNGNRLSELDGLKNIEFPSLISFTMSHNEFNCSYLETFFQKFHHHNLNLVDESYDTGTPIDTTDRVYGVNCGRDAKSTTIIARTHYNSDIIRVLDLIGQRSKVN